MTLPLDLIKGQLASASRLKVGAAHDGPIALGYKAPDVTVVTRSQFLVLFDQRFGERFVVTYRRS